jgi:hypothetical protein
MRKSNHYGEALALILGTALCASTAGLAAQSPSNPPPANPPQQGEQQQQADAQNKTFSGTIQKLPSGKYALVTGQTPDGKMSGHFLDDQENAQKYEGKQVKVTGTFDTGTNTIHVTNIQGS